MTQEGDFQASCVGQLPWYNSKEPHIIDRRHPDLAFDDIAGVFLCNYAEYQGKYDPTLSKEYCLQNSNQRQTVERPKLNHVCPGENYVVLTPK